MMKTCSTWVRVRKVMINDNNNNNCETNDKQNPLLTEFQFQEKSYISRKKFSNEIRGIFEDLVSQHMI